MNPVIIDIRENDEFRSEHIDLSIHIPMGEFPRKAAALIKSLGDKEIVLMCRSGRRAALANEQCRAMGIMNLSVYEGGILEWKRQGKSTVVAQADHLPIMRQVQIVSGGMVLISVALATWVDFRWIGLAAFVGAGISVAGFTGFCGMAQLLARMPWNRVK